MAHLYQMGRNRSRPYDDAIVVGGVLLAVDELREALQGDVPPALLDVRWELGGPPGWDRYIEGHIRGAVFVDLDRELSGPPGAGGRHPLPAAGDFEAAMRRHGVSGARPVVAYDAGNAIAAARAWWLLRYFGHRDVRVLHGGLAAWLSAGLEVERGAAREVEAGDFVARPGGMPLLDARGAGAVARAGVLLDARAPERYRGEREPVDPVAGHVPGAVNLPNSELIDRSGRFLGVDALRDRFARVGVHDDVQLGAYCGSGVAAAHEVLALELAGYRAALYVGSWSDWIQDPGRPVATARHS